MKCSDCKYWERPSDRYAMIPHLGECKRVMVMWDATEWSEGYERVLKEEFKDRKFFAQDGSDYIAYVITQENFFCAEFEKKE